MFEICKGASGYWWRLKARNGEILCHSEILTTKQSAQNAIAAVKQLAPSAITVDLT
ncbi:YegP family protein [Paracoccus sp. (in: a-proteobacteria)]